MDENDLKSEILLQMYAQCGRNKQLTYGIKYDKKFKSSYYIEVIECAESRVLSETRINVICKQKLALKLIKIMHKNCVYPIHVKDVLEDLGVRCLFIDDVVS